MPKKNFIPEKYRVWIDARKKHKLSHAHVQMARELGMNPKKFGHLDNHKQEPWKAPLPEFIDSLYFKRFGKFAPDNVRPLEQMVHEKKMKKEEKNKNKIKNNSSINLPKES